MSLRIANRIILNWLVSMHRSSILCLFNVDPDNRPLPYHAQAKYDIYVIGMRRTRSRYVRPLPLDSALPTSWPAMASQYIKKNTLTAHRHHQEDSARLPDSSIAKHTRKPMAMPVLNTSDKLPHGALPMS